MNDVGPVLSSGYRLHHFPVVGSTNDEAKSLARSGAPAGTVVWADAQSAGRGRRGREWQSPPGNLYMSLLQRPDVGAAAAAQLGFVTALSLSDALAETIPDIFFSSSPGLSRESRPSRGAWMAGTSPAMTERRNDAAMSPLVRLKWPNDVLINGRKISGILLESETGAGGALDFVVIGMGVNIATAPEGVEYPATSLASEGIANVTPVSLLAAFITTFDNRARQWRVQGFAAIREAWLSRATGIGESIRVRLERTTLDGRFVDLDQDGALLLQAAEGLRRITAGAVFPAV